MQCHALKGKTILFLGSSVTYGSAADGFSFVDELAAKTGCHAIKEAVSGTTLADLDVQSYVRRLKRVDPALFPDLFVCQLSTNDASQNVPLGRPDAPDADARTVAGAVRSIVGLARGRWRCPVAFYTNPRYDSASYQEMVDVLHILADAMQFSVIDLWNDAEMNAVSDSDYASYMADPIHPNRKGYEEWWGPKFAEYLLAAFTPAPVSSEAAPSSSGAAEEEGGSLPMLAVAAIAFVATLAVAGVVALIVTKAGGKKTQ